MSTSVPPSDAAPPGVILVVDDEDLVRDVTAMALEDAGYQVLCAEDGEKAVRLFGEHRQELSLVILDLSMPGMSGEDILATFAREDPAIPVILCSGRTEEEAYEQVVTAPAGFLKKPFMPAELVGAVRDTLAQAG